MRVGFEIYWLVFQREQLQRSKQRPKKLAKFRSVSETGQAAASRRA